MGGAYTPARGDTVGGGAPGVAWGKPARGKPAWGGAACEGAARGGPDGRPDGRPGRGNGDIAPGPLAGMVRLYS
jgi:hypothetical protein